MELFLQSMVSTMQNGQTFVYVSPGDNTPKTKLSISLFSLFMRVLTLSVSTLSWRLHLSLITVLEIPFPNIASNIDSCSFYIQIWGRAQKFIPSCWPTHQLITSNTALRTIVIPIIRSRDIVSCNKKIPAVERWLISWLGISSQCKSQDLHQSTEEAWNR